MLDSQQISPFEICLAIVTGFTPCESRSMVLGRLIFLLLCFGWSVPGNRVKVDVRRAKKEKDHEILVFPPGVMAMDFFVLVLVLIAITVVGLANVPSRKNMRRWRIFLLTGKIFDRYSTYSTSVLPLRLALTSTLWDYIRSKRRYLRINARV